MKSNTYKAILLPFLFSLSAAALASESPGCLMTEQETSTAVEAGDGSAPIELQADRIEGIPDKEIEASGDVMLRRQDQAIYADWLKYLAPSDELLAEGHVRIEQRGNVIRGERLEFNLESQKGGMDRPEFTLNRGAARGGADRFLLEGEHKYRAFKARYTTCPAGQDDWFLKVGELEIDQGRQVGVARNASIVFKGTTILYTPWLDFPLGQERKSGFLVPLVGSTVKGGPELTIPYYWNIAPNRDATISPRIMVKRGLQLNNEFRYLENQYSGIAHVEVLPDDKVANRSRYGLTLKHTHNFGDGWRGLLDLQKVSDDAYFRDLSDRISATSQTNLPREGMITYNRDWWVFTGRIQRFQTLQDPDAPVVPPYHRLPQLALSMSKPGAFGSELSLASEFVDFSHPNLPNGRRFTLYPSISYPLGTRGGYLTPKIGLHNTWYSLDHGTTTLPNTQRTVPIFSLDGGVFFERDWKFQGKPFLQTLEPRLYFVYIPFRDQNNIPNFDSAESDFNFAQMFTENRFSGGDRINDANQVTVAVTSRLLEPETGNEQLRVSLGQRLHFETQEVTLNTPASSRTRSDFLAALSGRILPNWLLDTGWQFNPNQSRTEKLSLTGRYRPEAGKVLNLGYRFTHDLLEHVDVSAQWPLSGRWHGLARWNYSLRDSKILEGIAGLEYNGGCWILRMVAHRFATATQETANTFFVQLELSGLGKVGADPIDVLRQNIPGYTELDNPAILGTSGAAQ